MILFYLIYLMEKDNALELFKDEMENDDVKIKLK